MIYTSNIARATRNIFFSIKIQLSFSFSLIEVFFLFVRGKVKPRSVRAYARDINTYPEEFTGVR